MVGNPECNKKRGFKNQLYIELGFLHENKYKSGLFNGMEFLSLAHCVQQNVNFSSIYLRLEYKQGSIVHSNFLSSEISWTVNNCSGGGNKILIMSSISVYAKGQTNSKWFFEADVSSKKWTNKFDFRGHLLCYVRTSGGWVVGSENGNFPLLYVVKMSLCRWVGGLKKPQNTLT